MGINFTGRNEHVPEIKRCIGTVKGKSTGYCEHTNIGSKHTLSRRWNFIKKCSGYKNEINVTLLRPCTIATRSLNWSQNELKSWIRYICTTARQFTITTNSRSSSPMTNRKWTSLSLFLQPTYRKKESAEVVGQYCPCQLKWYAAC